MTDNKPAKPDPQIFAIMRNGHEVIRGCHVDLKKSIDDGDIDASADLWGKLKKWMFMHMTMEEGKEGGAKGFFK